jgi:hypothetical protein
MGTWWEMIEIVSQVMIAICGISSCWLTATDRAKYACVWGLCAEPFWIYTSINNKQWGILVLAFVYAYMWSYGIYYHWFRNR